MIADLMSFTGLGAEEAAILLEAAGGDLAAAATLHFEQQDGPGAGSASATAAPDRPMVSDDEDVIDFDEAINGEPPNRGGGGGGGNNAAAGAVEDMPPPLFGAYPRLSYALNLLWRVPGIPMISSFALRISSFLYNMGLTGLLLGPLRILGLLPNQPRIPAGAPAVRRLESIFETDFGTTHPTFFRGTCQQALQRSRQEAKFVLVCLYSPSEPETAEFCRRVLSSMLFTAFANENFVFWLGDTGSSEGRSVRHALHVRSSPALVVLAHGDIAVAMGGAGGLGGGDGPAAQSLGSVQGARVVEEEQVIFQLSHGIYHTTPHHTILYHPISASIILYHPIPSCTILHHPIPSYTVLTILYHPIPSYPILHHPTPSYTTLSR